MRTTDRTVHNSPMGPRRLTIGFIVVAIALGTFQAWTTRLQMNPDGIQYLDHADAYWSDNLHAALNSQWSPLYPWILGAAFHATRVARFEQFPLVHGVNFALYLLSLSAFLFFIRSCERFALNGRAKISFLLLAYSAFLYCSLDLTNLGLVTPDLLVSLFAFLAGGFLLRASSGWQYAMLGAVVGLGYLAKAPFFIYALVCLALLCISRHRQTWLTAIVFASIAMPYVGLLSHEKGRFTFGDSGKFNVIWMVNGVPYRHWQGGSEANGRPIHPTRQLSAAPNVFEFDGPVGGTYPPWYDPIYWNEGARIAYRPADFARSFGRQLRLYGYLLHHRQMPLVFAILLLFLLVPAKRAIAVNLKPLWPILAFACVPFVMYIWVNAEGRYLAPFFVLLWASIALALIRSLDRLDASIPLASASVAAALMLGETAAAVICVDPIRSAHETAIALTPDAVQFEIARQLAQLGLKSGDHTAILGSDLPYSWARLAGARITMEAAITGDNRSQQWKTAEALFALHRIKLVVSPRIDGVVDQPGWEPLGATGAFVFRIRSDKGAVSGSDRCRTS